MQKQITVIRHAKSSWSNPGLRDFDRPLNQRGLRDAPLMADKLQDLGIKLDLILSSPSSRTLLTAEYFKVKFGCKIETVNNLYHGDVEDIIDSLIYVPDEIISVGIFCHNPGITFFANRITERMIDNVPTCGLLLCEIKENLQWQDIEVKDLELKSFIYPKMYIK